MSKKLQYRAGLSGEWLDAEDDYYGRTPEEVIADSLKLAREALQLFGLPGNELLRLAADPSNYRIVEEGS